MPPTRHPGSGPPPGPPRQADLDGSFGRWRVGQWSARLARVGGRRDGLPRPPRHPAAADGLRPSWSRCAPAGGALAATPATAASSPTRPACAAIRRAGPGRASPADCRPTTTPPVNGLSFCGGPQGFPLRAPAAGHVAWPERSGSGVQAARPGGGACGPLRAAVGSACGAVLMLPSVRFRRPPARTVHATRRRTRLSMCRAH
jgi:hypothetical protein